MNTNTLLLTLFSLFILLFGFCWLFNKTYNAALTRRPRFTRYTTLILTLSLFSWLTIDVALRGCFLTWNTPLLNWFQTLHTPFFNSVMTSLTFLGDKRFLIVVIGCGFLGLAYRRRWWAAWHWLANGALISISATAMKHIIAFPRPTILPHPPTSPSFPSGHTSFSFAVYGFIALLLAAKYAANRRWLIYFPFIALASLIAFSRLYLGVHWLTDIVGGMLLGLSCIQIVGLSFHRRSPSR